MDPHRLAEARSLAYHRVIAERLAADATLRARARARVASWRTTGEVHLTYVAAWEQALASSTDDLARLLTDPGEEARTLRQSSPFAGALSPRERWAIWREVGERAREQARTAAPLTPRTAARAPASAASPPREP